MKASGFDPGLEQEGVATQLAVAAILRLKWGMEVHHTPPAFPFDLLVISGGKPSLVEVKGRRSCFDPWLLSLRKMRRLYDPAAEKDGKAIVIWAYPRDRPSRLYIHEIQPHYQTRDFQRDDEIPETIAEVPHDRCKTIDVQAIVDDPHFQGEIDTERKAHGRASAERQEAEGGENKPGESSMGG